MSALNDRRKFEEESYFEKQNQEALKRIAQGGERRRPSPVTGEPMEQLTIMGVVVDRCPKSGGIWLDAGELEEIISKSRPQESQESGGWLSSFLKGLTSR